MRKLNRRAADVTELFPCGPAAIWGYVKSESFGFWAVCGYLFFEYVRPQSIYSWLDFFPWAASFLLLAFCGAVIEKKGVRKGLALNKTIGLYGAVIILSSLFAVWPKISFASQSYFWNWVLAYYVIVRLINTRCRFFVFLLLYLLCNFKMSQHGFISWAMKGFSFSGWGVTGAPGWFRNSGEFGIQLTIFIPLSIYFIISLKSYWGKKTKIFFYLMPVTGIGSIVATSSRGAIAGIIAAGLWAIRSGKYFLRSLIIFVLVSSLIYMITPPEFKARFASSGDDRTSTHRLDRWEKGLEVAMSYPLLGVGHKNWDYYFRRYLDNGQEGSAKIHNIFMESLTEHGFLGLITLISIFIVMFVTNSRSRKIAKVNGCEFEKMICYGLDIGTIGLMISASFVTVLYYPYIWIHAAFIAALHNVVFSTNYKATKIS